ncbi:MAG: 2-oxoacid:acceptor oxidoreductase family protein [Candidatus Omnitrophota bacterium]
MNKKPKVINILFCGIGGQGVLTASELCALAALLEGYHVKKSDVHGMAQRGGSVQSHLRFGEEVFSPLIPKGKVDYMLSLDKNEHDCLKDFLTPHGVDLIEYLERASEHIDDKKFLNSYLSGILSQFLSISQRHWLKAIEFIFSHKNLEDNKRFFLKGRNATSSRGSPV